MKRQMLKRMILGRFATSLPPAERLAASLRLAAAVLPETTLRAVYSEAVAVGPRGDAFGFDMLLESWHSEPDGFDPARAAPLAADLGFDPAATRTVLAEELVFQPDKAAVKGTFLSRRRPDLSVADYQAHWRGEHARVIQAQADFIAQVRGYVQNHFRPGTFLSLEGQPPGEGEGFDGAPQMWFDTVEAVHAAFATEGYRTAIRADEHNFLRVGQSQSFIAREIRIDPVDWRVLAG